MFTLRRQLPTQLMSTGVRYKHENPLGPSRGKYPPPWVVEKLAQQGHGPSEIRNNWRNLLAVKRSLLPFSEETFRWIYRVYDYSPAGIKEFLDKRKRQRFFEDQNFDPKMFEAFGPDLCAARFLVSRGASVKLHRYKSWFDSDDNLPLSADPAFRLEAIDLRDFQILPRAFKTLTGCNEIVSLKMTNQAFVDDWTIDTVSGLFDRTLQYLDVSNCPRVTDRGLSSLHRCKNLKMLIGHNLPNVQHRQLLALLLEESIPLIEIQGFNYLDEIGNAEKK